jgi:hypothetical protein
MANNNLFLLSGMIVGYSRHSNAAVAKSWERRREE